MGASHAASPLDTLLMQAHLGVASTSTAASTDGLNAIEVFEIQGQTGPSKGRTRVADLNIRTTGDGVLS